MAKVIGSNPIGPTPNPATQVLILGGGIMPIEEISIFYLPNSYNDMGD